jgi:hypothetical protein
VSKVTVVVAAAIAAGAALLAPWAAPQVAALLLAVLACIYVGSRLHGLAVQLPTADDRPLRPARKPRPGVPADLTYLALEIKTTRPGEPMRPAVVSCIRDLAAARLHDHHGLSVRNPADHPAIRPLVTDDLFVVLTLGSPSPAVGVSRPRPPRHDALPALIDEVERL